MADTVKQDIVTLNITMDNVLAVQVGQALASLREVVKTVLFETWPCSYLTSAQMVEI